MTEKVRSEAGAEAILQQARHRIAAVDRELMALVSERMRLATDVGQAKRVLGLPVRSFGTEAEVLARYRAAAAAAGLEHEFAEAVALLLIDGAVRRQEELSGRAIPTQAQSVVVVGGAGKMGRWFRGFFEGQGHDVRVIDPSLSPDDPVQAPDGALAEADLVVVAVSLAATPRVLAEVFSVAPRGLVLDIASLKSHLIEPLGAAAAAGLRVASLHPLFGPEVRTLGGRVMAVCDCGNQGAADEAAALFADTAVTITRLPIEEHDRYMQYVLGLSHLVSLLFAATVTRSGMTTAELNAMASTTWLKQVRTAAEVVGENPEMYHQIQRLNQHSAELFALMREQLGALESAALADEPGGFVALMIAAREFLPAEPGRVLG
ncbi:MAG TPA: prephenate dehydrogenase/arogenate dehydrogenase family protein [Gemmatimonadales bacterium]|nr:prephenate dehydrogenase/arogenate dehydrogenase family protein [Gemmatimonadales bacterium]